MADETHTFKASCICGNISHEISIRKADLPLRGYMCHCDSCRHMTGALCLTVTFLPAYYEPAKSLVDKLKGFQFSKRIIQYHCPTCGCQMMARCVEDAEDPDSKVTWDTTTGTLDDIDKHIDWQGHEFLSDTLDGGFADMLLEVHGKKLDRWPGRFGEGKDQLPVYWQSSSGSSLSRTSSDKLHAYCKCGGVDFCVGQPSPRSVIVNKVWPDKSSASDITESDAPDSIEQYWLHDDHTKFPAGLCGCDSCRLASGMEATFWAFVPKMDISLDKEGKIPFNFEFGIEKLKKYTSSAGCHRYFCDTCAATCFYMADDRKFMVDISVGLFAAAEGAKAQSWLSWRTSHLSFREDTVPRAEGLSGGIETALKSWEQHLQSEK
ncbi:hypothetical protein CB0940_06080 [Cercospora beticola]|uniref:CENP-V/GFA domain-containing protein n=1 Tax=Cercospora beticola TaxID=122368 RepID=A0A2G5HYE6_CERBT|nr:hypothetical protein CB0940_06080 [Cercospora beticola]PIA97584.1 hypothetical protein CB0940_06080 [Cercospora beticola]WPA98695.1 hypothetical protein RHO25_003308 [Cercospora beticola]CAK1359963.1 unnamed protein product [Cercospora beticola]